LFESFAMDTRMLFSGKTVVGPCDVWLEKQAVYISSQGANYRSLVQNLSTPWKN